MGFSSTEIEERPDAEAISAARKVRHRAQLGGLSAENQILKQEIKILSERCDRLEGLFMTLQGEFVNLKTQRAIELANLVNGGPTVAE